MARNLVMIGFSSLIAAALVLSQALLAPPAEQVSATPTTTAAQTTATDQLPAVPSSGSPQNSQSQTDTGLSLFRQQIQPLLAEKCLPCHHPDRDEGGLDLTSRQAALAGGDSGPAIVPGKPHQSMAYQLVTAFEMPPDLKNLLSPEETAALKRWIESGAPYGQQRLTVGDAPSGGGQTPADAMMCPCMEMMMDATRDVNSADAVALQTPQTGAEATERAEHFLSALGNPRLKVGGANETAVSYEVKVLTREDSLVNWIIVDKKTGQLKMLY